MRVTFIASMIAEFCRIMRKQVRRRVCRETTWYIFVLITVGCQTIQVPPAKQISSRTVLLPLTHVPVKDRSTDFTNLFCSVLDAEFSRDWGNCGQYIEDAASFDKVPLPALSTDYRLVIVEGILGSCVSNLSVYGEGVEHLRNVHHIDITTPMVDGLGSGVNNARQILAHVETLLKHDQRAIILLGYSKGAPDIQQFLLLAPPAVRNKIAGFISVAGMVGGSRLYDIFAENPDKFLRKLPTGPCGQDSGGFAELSRGTRQDFLRNHPDAIVSGYTYSLGAASSRENTSKILQPFWVYVSAFGREEDSQMTFPEQILPGSMFLGTAKADHWAVALPFEQDPKFRSAVNRNHFPRAPLLESLLRIVTSDLASPQRP